MGLTAFNRARRLAAQRLAQQQAQAPSQEQPEKSATVVDLEETDSESKSETVLTRDDRETELKALNWEALRDLLKSYELPTNKPKGISWDDFAIPQILEHEGF